MESLTSRALAKIVEIPNKETSTESSSLFISCVEGVKERSALDNIGWSGPDWSEFSDRPCDVIVRLLSRNKQIWRWSALLSFALCDKFAGGQLCWDNYSSVNTLKDWQSRFFRRVDECLHAFTILSLPTASLDVTSLYCCRGHYIT